MRWELGIDLGTESARVAEYGQGAATETAARLAFRDGHDLPVCCGDAAARIAGRACAGVTVVSPMKDGVLENNLYADRFLRWIYRQSNVQSRARRFGVMLACAPFARPVQQDALLTAATDAGAAEACLIRSDMAAAIGAGLDLYAPEAKLIVDIGAGKVACTLLTFGRVAAFGFLPYGLERIDGRIRRMVCTEGGHRIGLKSAREIKHTLGSAVPSIAPRDIIMHMTGFSMEKRLPEAFDLESAPVLDVCEEVTREIANLCVSVVSEVPEEISADLNDTGAILVGGGAEMSGMDKRIGDALGIPCRIADAPSKCAVRGLFEIMRAPEKYETAFLQRARKSNLK